MSLIDKLQTPFILTSVVLGVLLGKFECFTLNADRLIVPFLMLMLVIVFLSVSLRELSRAFSDIRFLSLSLGVNFLWTPIIAWLLGLFFLAEYPDLKVGLLMLLVTPCTDWYLIFTQMAGGDVPKSATLLPWHLILQLLLLPIYVYIFAHEFVSIDFALVLKSIGLTLVIPFTLAFLIRKLLCRVKGKTWFESQLLPKMSSLQLLFLCLAIMSMFSSQADRLLNNLSTFWLIALPLLIFYTLNLILSWNICHLGGVDERSSIGFCFATLARNSPLSLAVALTAFPGRPVIALVLVMGPLIELPLLAALSKVFRQRQGKTQR